MDVRHIFSALLICSALLVLFSGVHCVTAEYVSDTNPISSVRSIDDAFLTPGDNCTVFVTLTADQSITAPVLNEDVPLGWTVHRIEDDAHLFKSLDAEWMWFANLFEGESKSVTYKVTVPPDSATGTYIICGRVSAEGVDPVDTNGDYTIHVAYPPEADFTSNMTEGFIPLSLQFTDLSTDADEWKWDLGDGGVSSLQNPVHTYDDPGVYTVSLYASSNYGSDTETKADLITCYSVDFSANVTSGYDSLTIRFNDESFGIDSWEWDFGDGTRSFEENPVHTYNLPGTYEVTLNGSNDFGHHITVKNGYINVYSVDFNANVTKGDAPLAVKFTDMSYEANLWNWNFGDGGTSCLQDPIHTYDKAGNYTVSLTTSDGQISKTETKVGYVEISEAITASRNISEEYADPGDTIVVAVSIYAGGSDLTDVTLCENVPEGCSIVPIQNSSFVYDITDNCWYLNSSLFPAGSSEMIIYEVNLDSNVSGSLHFDGVISALKTDPPIPYIYNVSGDSSLLVNDWNPWNDPDSAGYPDGSYITIGEVIDAYNCWRSTTPAPLTGANVSIDKVIDLYNAWRFSNPM